VELGRRRARRAHPEGELRLGPARPAPRPRVLQLWEGSTHPQTLTRLAADALYAPIIDPRDGATFVLARARDGNFLYQIRANGDAPSSPPASARARVRRRILPDGSIAVAKWNGDIAASRATATCIRG
jgi:hypothetical protein